MNWKLVFLAMVVMGPVAIRPAATALGVLVKMPRATNTAALPRWCLALALVWLCLACASRPVGAQAPAPVTIAERYEQVHDAVVRIETVESELSDLAEEGFVRTGAQGSGVLVSADGKVVRGRSRSTSIPASLGA